MITIAEAILGLSDQSKAKSSAIALLHGLASNSDVANILVPPNSVKVSDKLQRQVAATSVLKCDSQVQSLVDSQKPENPQPDIPAISLTPS